MNDDWRVQVTCPTTATAASLGEALREGEFQHDMQHAAGERVIVSVDGPELFLYAGSRAQADRAADAVKALVARSNPSVRTELRRWHPVSEEWVDAGLPLPETEAAVAAEHAETIERERAESASLGYSEYEVRVSTSSHRETLELAEQLRADNVPVLRRWRYLVIGASDEDSAAALADRVRALAPADTTVAVEASAPAAEAGAPPNPFAVFGGLGG
ncbi:MAG: hypothetical protein KGL16_10035 [Acidobacteriota bacterium]|nr:hypothetical protein [Acidobacteriota bacterium]